MMRRLLAFAFVAGALVLAATLISYARRGHPRAQSSEADTLRLLRPLGTSAAAPKTAAPLIPEAPAATASRPPTAGARLTGTVSTKDGAPCTALIVAFGAGQQGRHREETHSAVDGKYVLPLASGQWCVHAESAVRMSDPLWVDVHDQEAHQDLVLLDRAAVWGVLTDPQGAAAPGSVVTCSDAEDSETNRATTQADGSYHMAVPTGFVLLRSDVCGFAPAIASSIVSAGQEARLDLRLGRSLRISGCITDEHGRAIAGQVVSARLDSSHERDVYLTSRSATTGADGRYEIADLINAPHLVRTAHEGNDQCRHGVPAGATDVDFVLATPGRIEGRIIDRATVAAINGRWVLLCLRQAGNWSSSLDLWQNSEEPFSFEDVPPGKYVVYAKSNGYAQSHSDVFEVRPGETTRNADVRMSRGGNLHVVVRSARTGLAVARAEVDLDRAIGSTRIKTDDQGSCILENIESGEWKLSVDSPRRGPYFAPQHSAVTILEGQTAQLEYHLQDEASIYGRALLVDGQPLVGGLVTANDPALDESQREKTGHDGSFNFHGLCGGRYFLSYEDPNTGRLCRSPQPIDVRDGEAVMANLSPTPGVHLSGVVHQGGQAVPNAEIILSCTDTWDCRVEFHPHTGGDGIYSVADVPPGNYELRIGTLVTKVTVPDGVHEFHQDLDLPAPAGR